MGQVLSHDGAVLSPQSTGVVACPQACGNGQPAGCAAHGEGVTGWKAIWEHPKGEVMSESAKTVACVEKKSPSRRRFAERGLTTVEYAIGLLGAAAAAMLLLRVFNDNSLFDMIMKWVTDLFVNAAQHDA